MVVGDVAGLGAVAQMDPPRIGVDAGDLDLMDLGAADYLPRGCGPMSQWLLLDHERSNALKARAVLFGLVQERDAASNRLKLAQRDSDRLGRLLEDVLADASRRIWPPNTVAVENWLLCG
ncbi:hypothetical protein [Halochromatium sp.]